MLVVGIRRDVVLGVGDGRDQAYGVIRELGDVAQGIGDLRELALGVIGKLGDAGRGRAVGRGEVTVSRLPLVS